MYETPYLFEFQDDGVIMSFQENTNHDCPEYESVCLKITELEKNELDWVSYIENIKKETVKKAEFRKQNEERQKLETKKKQFESLKNELGY